MNVWEEPVIMPVYSESEKEAKLTAGWTITSTDKEKYTDESGEHEKILMYLMRAPEKE